MYLVMNRDNSITLCNRFCISQSGIPYTIRIPQIYNYPKFFFLLYNTKVDFITTRMLPESLYMDMDKENIPETNLLQNEDIDLIRKVVSGDSSSYAILVKKYWNQFYFQALSYVHNPTEAEDILQQAYLKIYQNLGKLQDPAKFLYWSLNIIRHICLNYIHKKKRESESMKDYADTVQLQHQPTGISDDIRGDIDQSNQMESVMNAITELPKKYRKIAIYYFTEGYTCIEIANKLHLTTGAVKIRVHRIKKKFRESLQGKL